MRYRVFVMSIFLVVAGSACDGGSVSQCEPGRVLPTHELRNPQTGQCEAAGSGCTDCACLASDFRAQNPDWAECHSLCDSLDEVTCKAADACRAIYFDHYLSNCGADASCGHMYSGCWGTAPSGPITGGGCVGLDAQACSQHDDCSAVYNVAPDGSQAFGRCEGE